jgi:hypothetical protein
MYAFEKRGETVPKLSIPLIGLLVVSFKVCLTSCFKGPKSQTKKDW